MIGATSAKVIFALARATLNRSANAKAITFLPLFYCGPDAGRETRRGLAVRE